MKPMESVDKYRRQFSGVDLWIRFAVGFTMWTLGGAILVWLGSVVF